MANTDQFAQPQAGKDYPRNYADFLGWFPDDAPVSIIWIGYAGPQDFRVPNVHVTRGGAWVIDAGGVKLADVGFPLHRARSSTTHKHPSPCGSLRLGT